MVSQGQPSGRSPGPGLQPGLALGLPASFSGRGARASRVLAPCRAQRQGTLSGVALPGAAERLPGGGGTAPSMCPRRTLRASRGSGAAAVYRALEGHVSHRWDRRGPERAKDLLGAVPQPQPGGARVKAQAAQAHLGPPWGSVRLGRRPWGQREGGAQKGRRDLEHQGQDLASILRGGHCRGVTAAGSPPWGHHRGVTAAGPRECCPLCLCASTGQGEADPREWAGERGPPRVWGVTAGGASCPGWSRGPVLGAEGRTIRTTEAGGLWAEAPRRPQAGGSGGGCGQLASDCPVSPGKTPCRDRTGTSTLALTTRPSPAPSAPQGPRPAPGEPPSGATCHSARPACPCFGRSPRVRGGEPTAPSQRGDVE